MSDDLPHADPSVSPALKLSAGLVMALAVILGSPIAEAASTRIGTSSDSNELSQSQILEYLYGGAFTQQGDSYSNGSVTVDRVDDTSGVEQIFQGELVSARTVATFSRNTQTFGIKQGGRVLPLFTATGAGLEASGSADLTGRDLSSAIFALQSGGNEFDSAGGDEAERLIAYTVSGSQLSEKTALLFWEDAMVPYADFDYNDLVVQLAGRGTADVLIPLPAAAWSGLSLLCGVSLMSGIRKLRSRLR